MSTTLERLIPQTKEFVLSDQDVELHSGSWKLAAPEDISNLAQRKGMSVASETTLFDPDAAIGYPTIFEDPAYPDELSIVYYDGMVDIAFHLVKYLRNGEPTRILDVGGYPMQIKLHEEARRKENLGLYLGYEEHGALFMSARYPLSAVLSLHPDISACSVDVIHPSPDTRWLYAGYVEGDFQDIVVQEKVIKVLGGKPDVVMCNLVLVNDLWDNMTEDVYGHPLETSPKVQGDPVTLPERLSEVVWEFMEPGTYLIVHNGTGPYEHYRDSFLPRFLRKRKGSMTHLYQRNLTRVYQK